MPTVKQPAVDPTIEMYAQGLAALQQKKYAKAVELLEKVLAESDRSDLRDRARQLLAASREKAAAEGAGGKSEGKGKKSKEAKEAPAAPAEPADPFLQAVFEKNRGNHAAALEIARQREQKDERFAYLVAAIHAAENRLDEAVQALNRAVELNPKNRIHAFHDPDFAELRKNKDYRHVFGLS
jgi:tetratricopeptide (TPR) repeat protein